MSRYQSSGNVLTLPRPGQPNVLNAQQKQEVIEKVEEDPFLTAVELAREYNVSYMTIIRVLKTHGLHCRTAATQTRLTEDHKINRVAFCQTLLENWDENKLTCIIFSDEKTFCSDIKWKKIVYRPINKRYDANYTKTQNLSGRISAAYFGAISIDGPVTDIVPIQGRFNSTMYLNILKKHIRPLMQQNRTRIYMQDNSPVHTAKKACYWHTYIRNIPGCIRILSGVKYSDIEFYHGWYKSRRGKIATKLIRDISIALNEDCIDEIAKQLDIISFADLFSRCSSSRLNKIASRRFGTLVINRVTVGHSFDLMNMYYVLLVMGDIVTDITIAFDSFRGGHTVNGNKKLMYSILYHVYRLTGHKLNSVSLQKFQINMNIPYFRSIIDKLQLRHVVINIE